ncbi:MAG TPA: esterase family protein [Candidatus Hungatella pullicola]|nr:esterase family protein [Candidatus Hungatella pullicola]
MALLHVDFFSVVLEEAMSMKVILPQRAGKEEKKQEEKLSVLYLLHGKGDDESSWQKFTSIERYARGKNLAVIMPTTHLGFYTDTQYGLNYYQFISQELPEICHQFFPQLTWDRKKTYVAGLSMGGYGAFKLALSKPECFGAAASLSGVLDLEMQMEKMGEKENWAYWKGIFGDSLSVRGTQNDILYLAENLVKEGKEKPRLFTWCGKQDFLYENNVKTVQRMREMGYKIDSYESDGDHRWEYWDEWVKKVLEWVEE